MIEKTQVDNCDEQFLGRLKVKKPKHKWKSYLTEKQGQLIHCNSRKGIRI